MQKYDAVSQFLGQAHVMRYHDAGELELVLQFLDEVAQKLRHEGIDHGGGFVIKNAFRLGRKRAGNGHATLHPGRKVGGKKVAHGLHAYHVQQAVDNLVNLLFVQVMALTQRKGHVFTNAERIEQRAVLKYHGYFFADPLQLRFGGFGDVLKRNYHASGVGLKKSHDVME